MVIKEQLPCICWRKRWHEKNHKLSKYFILVSIQGNNWMRLKEQKKNRIESEYNRDYSAFFRRRWIYRNNILKNEYRFYLSYFSVKNSIHDTFMNI